jgi:hypothetical protein
MIGPTLLVLFTVLKISTAKLLLSTLIISIAIIHEMIMILLDDCDPITATPKRAISYFIAEPSMPVWVNRLRTDKRWDSCDLGGL